MTMPNNPLEARAARFADDEAAFRARRLAAYRDDGPIAAGLGRLARGQLPPLPPLIVAAVVTLVLLVAGVGGQTGLGLLAPVLALLLAGPGSAHPHGGRLDWAAPVIIRLIEYGYLATVGFSHAVPKPLVYALLGVLAFHHYDTVYRTRQRLWPAAWVFGAGLGWDGRMLIAGIAAIAHVAWPAYAVLTFYLGVLFVAESVHAWSRADQHGVMADLEEEDVAETAPPDVG
ncbi:hypothetical protein Airi02_029550 [Actinoallomurus iriomotensis]|uniref:DUF5941 domain-containing protein n=2 Tax=Actinoallomurus iriomotensis TaxID=478107 RepID=A0A9W6W0L1_9ACTN|nr:hypothetical protein Airi02_029550 [Actinoallomurus iriomotensis]